MRQTKWQNDRNKQYNEWLWGRALWCGGTGWCKTHLLFIHLLITWQRRVALLNLKPGSQVMNYYRALTHHSLSFSHLEAFFSPINWNMHVFGLWFAITDKEATKRSSSRPPCCEARAQFTKPQCRNIFVVFSLKFAFDQFMLKCIAGLEQKQRELNPTYTV